MHLITYNMVMDYINKLDDTDIIGKTNHCCRCPFANIIESNREIEGVWPTLNPNKPIEYVCNYFGKRDGKLYGQILPDWVGRAINAVDGLEHDLDVKYVTVAMFRDIVHDAVRG